MGEASALGLTDVFGEGLAVAFGVGFGVALCVGFGVRDGFGVGDFGVGWGVARGVGVGTTRSESVGGTAGSGDNSGSGDAGSAGDASGTSCISGLCDSVDSSSAEEVGSERAADAISPAAASAPSEPGLTQTKFSSFLSG